MDAVFSQTHSCCDRLNMPAIRWVLVSEILSAICCSIRYRFSGDKKSNNDLFFGSFYVWKFCESHEQCW